MIKILEGQRIFYYNKKPIIADETTDPWHCKWEQKSYIDDVSAKMFNDPGRLEFFSPCLTRYMITNKRNQNFIIKDTETREEVCKVPLELMSSDPKDPKPS